MQSSLSQSTAPADAVRPIDITIRRSALVAAALSSFLTPFMASAVNIALPSIGQDLAIDAVLLSWVSLAYSLAAVISFDRATLTLGWSYSFGASTSTIMAVEVDDARSFLMLMLGGSFRF